MWYLVAWIGGGAALSLLYLLILEAVEKRYCLECADRYYVMRLYRWIHMTFEDKRTNTGVEDWMLVAIGPIPPLLGLSELGIRLFLRHLRPPSLNAFMV